MKRAAKAIGITLATILMAGFLVPEHEVIPVAGGTNADWNHNTFWYEPWGSSGVHKGIDIFGAAGTPVLASVVGLVVFEGNLVKGGNAILILGPKWRLHYYAHLRERTAKRFSFVSRKALIGLLGATGNASSKSPHLHYSIVTLVPYPWKVTGETQGWKKMFYLNPHEQLRDAA